MSLAKANLKKLRRSRYIPKSVKRNNVRHYVNKALNTTWYYRERPRQKIILQITHDTLIMMRQLSKSGLISFPEEQLLREIQALEKSLITGRLTEPVKRAIMR